MAGDPVPSARGVEDPFDGTGLMRDVRDYVGFGTHRTGSAGDRATSDWFARHFRAHGYAVEQVDVTCPDTDTTVARLETRDLVPLCETAFEGHPAIGTPKAADPPAALGEFRLILAQGYPSCAGFWGANACFHTSLDDATTTTGAIMAPIARGVAQVIATKLSALARHPRGAATTGPAALR